jgi:hypothetical protein
VGHRDTLDVLLEGDEVAHRAAGARRQQAHRPERHRRAGARRGPRARPGVRGQQVQQPETVRERPHRRALDDADPLRPFALEWRDPHGNIG